MDRLEQAALSGALTSHPFSEPDPDGNEPLRWEDLSDNGSNGSCSSPHLSVSGNGRPPSSQGMSRGWSGNTGPKGVLQDFKASHGKSGAILGGGVDSALDQRLERFALRNGRSTPPGTNPLKKHGKGTSGSSSSESEGEREIKEARRRERMAELASQKGGRRSPGNVQVDEKGRKLFGHLREVGVDNFVQAIDAEKDDQETAVVVHLYEPELESCAILNAHLSTLARLHPRTKFLRGLASELDYFNDSTPSYSASSGGTAPGGYHIPTLTPSPSRTSFSTMMTSEDPFKDQLFSRKGSITSLPTDPFADQRRRRPTDSDVLPTLVWYRSGDFVKSIVAVERELPDQEIKRGEEGCKEVQALLASHGLVSISDSFNGNGRMFGGTRHSRSMTRESGY